VTTLSGRERSYAVADADAPPPFEKVICAVEADREGNEAVRQAATLAGPGGKVVFMAAAERAFPEALAVAGRMGADASVSLMDGAVTAYALLEQAGPDDLVVAAADGSAAATLLHRSPSALLIARPGRSPRHFPRELLVASDGSPPCREALRLTAAIARRHHSQVSHLRVVETGVRLPPADEVGGLERATGTPPTVLLETGSPQEAILAKAGERRCSLVILGHSGVSGVRSPGRLSERVASEAPCSVLVGRAANGRS
jgi:nucleotide-binding universal stress UspA family protein